MLPVLLAPHLKKFRLLCFGLDAEALTVPCRGGRQHLRIEGKDTRLSAVYVPRLAEHFAGFAPTRLNIADDPTREAEIRPSSEKSCIAGLPFAAVQSLNSRNFSRPYAGWVRLCLLLGLLPRSTAFDLCAPSTLAPTNLAPAWIFPVGAILLLLSVVWISCVSTSLITPD